MCHKQRQVPIIRQLSYQFRGDERTENSPNRPCHLANLLLQISDFSTTLGYRFRDTAGGIGNFFVEIVYQIFSLRNRNVTIPAWYSGILIVNGYYSYWLLFALVRIHSGSLNSSTNNGPIKTPITDDLSFTVSVLPTFDNIVWDERNR